jgi:transcriptional regulator with XRE-family HTH domain
MIDPHARLFGALLKQARQAAGLSQTRLAAAGGIPRLRVVRAESGEYPLRLDEALQVAAALKIPLERLTSGRWMPCADLQGIGLELYQLGLRDLEVAGASVPGAFRQPAEVVALALAGDRPEPRIIEGMPTILARRKLTVPLTLAFADKYDPRVRTRLAWLSDVTLTLHQLSTFVVEVISEAQLQEFVRAGVRPEEPDSLGHPREGPLPRLWARWNISYVGDLQDFLRRAEEVETAYRFAHLSTEFEE